ncbi:MAG: CoA transferase, partial [Chloroflexi bacterium]|nr:CoA transferase [Chloroflexota bacterium]
MASNGKQGFLFDVRVLELADETGEFCGKLLAGAGADVVKIEPPGGSDTRNLGPFYHDETNRERSLYFWHYNFGKRGITLDVTKKTGQDLLKRAIAQTDVFIETRRPGELARMGIGYDELSRVNPRLIMASITPFGQSGPWRDWKSSDIVQLALGGQLMMCGYDPTPEGEYDTPPIAPQMWHASHIVGNQTCMAIVAALMYRETSGQGQYIDASMHAAAAVCTEMDIPYAVYKDL